MKNPINFVSDNIDIAGSDKINPSIHNGTSLSSPLVRSRRRNDNWKLCFQKDYEVSTSKTKQQQTTSTKHSWPTTKTTTSDFWKNPSSCKYWAVTTTTATTTAMNHHLSSKRISNSLPTGWCLVVTCNDDNDNCGLVDTNSHGGSGSDGDDGTKLLDGIGQVIYLTIQRQKELGKNFPFFTTFQQLPNPSPRDHHDHVSSKNIGYLYAIAHGADAIFDFDIMLIANSSELSWPYYKQLERFLVSSKSTTLTTNTPTSTTLLQFNNVNNEICSSFNPYNIFIATPTTTTATTTVRQQPIWPRGYPLEDIQKMECQLDVTYCTTTTTTTTTHQAAYQYDDQIGIYQLISSEYLDVDTLYRFSHGDPKIEESNRATTTTTSFGSTLIQDSTTTSSDTTIVAVPPNTFAPINAQMTIFKKASMWSLLLPSTTSNRVSDIWRSYIAQTLGKQYGMVASFMKLPFHDVTNNRLDGTSLSNDIHSELVLYEKSGALIEYLKNWKYVGGGRTFEGSMERLYVDLYEHGIIEWTDVELAQQWLNALISINYEFPILNHDSSKRPPNILEGRCKSSDTSLVPISISKSSVGALSPPRYPDVVLVGQFNYDIDTKYIVHFSRRWSEFFGFVQVRGPFNSTKIAQLAARGVQAFYGADDAGYYSPMKNMAETLRMYADNREIRGVLYAHDDLILNLTQLEILGFPSNTEILTQVQPDVLKDPYLEFSRKNTFRRRGHASFSEAANFESVKLKSWRWWSRCIPSFANASSLDGRAEAYVDTSSGLVNMYANAKGDFAYVPMKYAAQFSDMADWLTDNSVFLECGFPTIFGHLRDAHNATVKFVEYCTSPSKNRGVNNYPTWSLRCFNGNFQRSAEDYYFPSYLLPKPPFGLYHPLKLSVHGTHLWDVYFDMIARNVIPDR